MTIIYLKNLANTAKFAELFEILDSYFDKNPDYQYSNLKQNILHQLSNGGSPTPAHLQGLLVFLNGRVVKENLGNIAQAMEAQKNNTTTNNGNGNMTIQDDKVIINNGTNINPSVNSKPNTSPNLKTLYNTLNQKLNDESFNLFCLLHFEEVHNNFTAGQSKTVKITALLDYAKRKDLLGKLEQDLKEFLG